MFCISTATAVLAFGGVGPSFEISDDPLPQISNITITSDVLSTIITANIQDTSGVASAGLILKDNEGVEISSYVLFDDGAHGDSGSADSIYGAFIFPSECPDGIYSFDIFAQDVFGNERYLSDVGTMACGDISCVSNSGYTICATVDQEVSAFQNCVQAEGRTICITPGTSSSGLIEPSLSLSVPAASQSGGQVSISATLLQGGSPLAGKIVTFTDEKDGVEMASITTNASGIAAFSYAFPFSTMIGDHTIAASFAGDGITYTPANDSKIIFVDTARNTFHYRREIRVQNNYPGHDLIDYQLPIIINTAEMAGKIQPTCDDIMFNEIGGQGLEYYLDSGCGTAETLFWVKNPYISGSTIIYVYYGDPSFSSFSSGKNTFDLFEDWESGALDTSYWTAGGSTSPYWQTYSSTRYQGSYSGGNNNIGDDQQSWIKKTINLGMQAVLEFYWSVGSEPNYDYLYYCINNDSCTRSAGYISRISDNVPWTPVSRPLAAGQTSIKFAYAKDGSDSWWSDTGYIDSVRVRKYLEPALQPTYELGAEEPFLNPLFW